MSDGRGKLLGLLRRSPWVALGVALFALAVSVTIRAFVKSEAVATRITLICGVTSAAALIYFALVPTIRAFYYRHGGRHGELRGSELLSGNAEIEFEPIVVSGLWHLRIAANAGNLRVDLIDRSGAKDTHIYEVSSSSRRTAPVRGWTFWVEEPSATPQQLKLYMRITDVQSLQSFRLAKSAGRVPTRVKWRLTLDGWCKVLAFPPQPAAHHAVSGFPVIPPDPANPPRFSDGTSATPTDPTPPAPAPRA
jgi:hypothetical protein